MFSCFKAFLKIDFRSARLSDFRNIPEIIALLKVIITSSEKMLLLLLIIQTID